jgi:Na+/H+ antiporter NhaD/arsenite permease-like protein
MALTALIAIVLAGPVEGLQALSDGFMEFAYIAVIFTAIAVPSHQLERSGFLAKIGMRIGNWLEFISSKLPIKISFAVIAMSLVMTYTLAATLHNTTSILVSATIITALCSSYKIPAIPVLGGALVASNLGGFSTRWGDTPNIIEAKTWGLNHAAFFQEIMPINIGLLIILIIYVQFRVSRKNSGSQISSLHLALRAEEFRESGDNILVNMRLTAIGIVGITIAVIGSMFFPKYELILSALAVIFCVAGDYPNQRSKAMMALGMHTYATLASIFVLAQVMAHTGIGVGDQVISLLGSTDASTWGTVMISCLGTLLTEAASWASAAASLVFNVDPTIRSAWALGAGICAGSSSVITAATAGVILLNETSGNPKESRMTFGNYLSTGLSFSTIMIVYYVLVLTLAYAK